MPISMNHEDSWQRLIFMTFKLSVNKVRVKVGVGGSYILAPCLQVPRVGEPGGVLGEPGDGHRHGDGERPALAGGAARHARALRQARRVPPLRCALLRSAWEAGSSERQHCPACLAPVAWHSSNTVFGLQCSDCFAAGSSYGPDTYTIKMSLHRLPMKLHTVPAQQPDRSIQR